MRDYIQVTIDNQSYYLLKQPDDSWRFTYRTPPLNGLNPKVVTITSDDGKWIIDTSDTRLLEVLTAYLNRKFTYTGSRMINYYPEVISVILEYQALIHTLGFEIDFLHADMYLALDDSYLLTMGEERINQWEKILGIPVNTNYSVDDRRDVVVARIRGGYKLNTASINDIVNAFTGGTAETYFEDSCIHVLISPPPNNKQYIFENVERELERRKPAHLNIEVSRNYATWEEIKNNFTSWNDIKTSFNSWEDVIFYVKK